MRNEEQLRHATVILGELRAAENDIHAYGITDGFLRTFGAAVREFERAVLLRDAGVAQRKVTRAHIHSLLIETGSLLTKELDPIMQVLRTAHPMIYRGYKGVRVTKALAVRYRKNTGNSPEHYP